VGRDREPVQARAQAEEEELMAIKPGSAKQKGRQLQQYVCKQIAQITGLPWGSSGEDQPIESRPMGQSGPDIRMETHALKRFPFSVECKRVERWDIHTWIDQAKQNRMANTSWLIIAKRSRRQPVAIMDAEDFFALVKELEEYRNG